VDTIPKTRYPSLFQINTRVRLTELSASLGRAATFDDIPDTDLDSLANEGFNLVWFLGVWQTGEAARRISASTSHLLDEYRQVLPDFRDSDVCGSCFAVRDYRAHSDFGGKGALLRLRERLNERGLRLILDFVPNHVAPDHPWVETHPEFFVQASEERLAAEPENFSRFETALGSRILAYGRDPYFDGWSDTLQLNYGNSALQEAMLGELLRVAAQCDGVRCDMAMLILPEIFFRTWGISTSPFWPQAIESVRKENPDFLFLAEVYWDLEWELQQQGFDYTYDKRLYDRLKSGEARPVRAHLAAGLDFQDRLARFLENHDEPRAAMTFPQDIHRAAAVITYLTPGLRFLHQGQREGKRVRIPVHLSRGPLEEPDPAIEGFYTALLSCLNDPALRNGEWKLLAAAPAWEGNGSNEEFIVCSWTGPGDLRRLVAVNYASHPSQCYVNTPWDDLSGQTWRFQDCLSSAEYEKSGDEVAAKGLYLDLPAWGVHLFQVTQI
jgi:hypothetical protein